MYRRRLSPLGSLSYNTAAVKQKQKREQTLQSYLESPACPRFSLFPLTSASLFAGPHCPHALAATCKAKPPLISLTPFFNLSRLPPFCLLINCSLRIWKKKNVIVSFQVRPFHHGVLERSEQKERVNVSSALNEKSLSLGHPPPAPSPPKSV